LNKKIAVAKPFQNRTFAALLTRAGLIFQNQTTMLRFPSLFFFFVIIIAACKNDPSIQIAGSETSRAAAMLNEPVDKQGAITYAVSGGTVLWSGKKTVGTTHEGIIAVSSGELLVVNGRLASGHIVLDMHSLSVTSIKDGGEKRDLESHLKDVDFFEVDQFPNAEFRFTEVLPNSNTPDFNQIVPGTLTIKGKNHPVNIPVYIKISKEGLTVRSPSFPINRTKWGITFRSGLLGTVKDKLIEDTVLLTLKLTAKRQ